MAGRVCVIVNPAAGRGRGAGLIPQLTTVFSRYGGAEIRTSSSPGEERAVAEAALGDGASTIVAVGGDGTTANIANAILHLGGSARLAVFAVGTGNDFSKTLGLERAGIETLARLCFDSSDRRVDTGRIEDVYFLNSCGFGFDVAVLEGMKKTRWMPGRSVYLYTALREIFGYRGIEIGIRSAASVRHSALHMLLVIANASQFGGGFTIAPGASVSDGLLDAVSILDLPAAQRVAMLAAATKGTHVRRAGCVIERSESFHLEFTAPPAFETDGELHHARAASLQVISCPAALRVIAAPRAV